MQITTQKGPGPPGLDDSITHWATKQPWKELKESDEDRKVEYSGWPRIHNKLSVSQYNVT